MGCGAWILVSVKADKYTEGLWWRIRETKLMSYNVRKELKKNTLIGLVKLISKQISTERHFRLFGHNDFGFSLWWTLAGVPKLVILGISTKCPVILKYWSFYFVTVNCYQEICWWYWLLLITADFWLESEYAHVWLFLSLFFSISAKNLIHARVGQSRMDESLHSYVPVFREIHVDFREWKYFLFVTYAPDRLKVEPGAYICLGWETVHVDQVTREIERKENF